MKWALRCGVAVALLQSMLGLLPSSAEAHGPVAPVASSYMARVTNVPPHLDAKVVDGDQRLCLRVPAGATIVVLDYRGAPYLRFSPRGVEVNRNSAMFYLNQSPVALTPPARLTRATPPLWQSISHSHIYSWHDGRLHALATVALAPGARYVGRWSIPLLVNSNPSSVSGGLWHADNPSLVWFWPIIVVLLCLLAAMRVQRENVDRVAARALGLAALAGIAVIAVGRELHGRPTQGTFQLVELGLLLAFVLWGLHRVVFWQSGYFRFVVIAFVALVEGVELVPTLLHGFVLLSIPAFLARAATVACITCGAGLLLVVFQLPEGKADDSRAGQESWDNLDDADGWVAETSPSR